MAWFWLLFVLYIFGWFWWGVAAIGLYIAVRLGLWSFSRWQKSEAERRARDAEIAARADQQHAWAMADDPRGTYGEYQPADI